MRNQKNGGVLVMPRRREDRECLMADLTEGFSRMPRAAVRGSRPVAHLYDDVKRGRRSPLGWLLELLDAMIDGGTPLHIVEAPIRRLLAYMRGRYRRLAEPTLGEVLLHEAEAEGEANAAVYVYALAPNEANRVRAMHKLAAHLTALELLYETVATPRLVTRRSA